MNAGTRWSELIDRRLALRFGGWACVALAPVMLGPVGCSGTTGSPAAAGPTTTAPLATARVTKRDLATTESISGTLGYGATRPLSSAKQGTVTAVVKAGEVVDRGGALWRVDGFPVVLFIGEVPLWRELSSASTDDVDILVLKHNLRDLGYFDGLLFNDDDTFDAATTLAVKAWQKALGVEQSGSVAFGAVVVATAPVRVASVDAGMGSSTGGGGTGGAAGGVVTVTGLDRVVSVSLDADKRAKLPMAREVNVVMPGGATVAAKVTEVSRVASAADGAGSQTQDQTPKVAVTISLTGTVPGADHLDSTPVKVRIVSAEAKGVLAVPVGALVALREGGIAVEMVDDGATGRYVGVTPGLYADGWVEVRGDLREGDTVVTTR